VVVERLRAAGAIILGKTNVPTMLSDWQTSNAVFGVTKNPWDITKTPGGSSGGSAAALASGMTALEFGSDLAGSLRIPAAFCGVFAHRPSHGLVPMRGFAPPMAPRTPIAQPVDQSVVGPLARSAADLCLALDVIAGPDVPDSTAYQLALPPPRHTALRDFRVLALDVHPMVPTSDSIRDALARLAGQLEREGCTVGRSAGEIPNMKDLTGTFSALLMSMLSADMPQAPANAMSHREWIRLDRHRLELSAQWETTFQEWDIVVCPAAPTTVFPLDDRPFGQRIIEVNGSQVSYQTLPLWSALAAPCGLPVTTAPIGRDAAGLPIGVQIVGPRLEDRTPLAFAGLLESALGHRFVTPREK
jgi:amidase